MDPPVVPDVKYGPAFVPDDPRVAAAWKGRSSKALFLVPLVAVVVGAILVIGLITAVRSGGDDSSGGGLGGVLGGSEEKADVLSVAGYQDLLAAVREQAGSTTAFSAVLYPTYAVVELPVDETTQHEEYWYWDGHDLTNNGVKSSSSAARTDLADLDAQVVVDLVQKVRRKLPDATSVSRSSGRPTRTGRSCGPTPPTSTAELGLPRGAARRHDHLGLDGALTS